MGNNEKDQPIPEKPHFHTYKIQIDRTTYEVSSPTLTGEELRKLPSPPIGDDRDLFEIVPGSDRKIEDDDVVKIQNGKRFFTAPSHINPGLKT